MTRASKSDLFPWLLAVLFCACYLWIFLGLLHPMQDRDLWWHLASGRDILQHRRIPSVDVFSLTASGTRWINSYWLYDVAVYELYAHFGSSALILLHAFAVLGIFYFVDHRLKGNGVPWGLRLAALAVLYWGGAPSGGYWGPQASLVTLFFVSALLCAMDAWKREGWSSSLWFWVPLFFIWANLHRGFLLALCIAAFYVLSNERREDRRRSWIWLLSCAVVTCITPHPFGLFRMIWDDFSYSPERIMGWLAPVFGHMKVFTWTIPIYWIFSLCQPVALVRSWPLTVLALLLTIGSVQHVVYVSYFMIYAVPATAIQLSGLLKRLRWPLWTNNLEWPAMIAAAALLAAGIHGTRPTLGIIWSDVYDFIRSENIQGPFYNDYIFGGQWMWAFAGNPPVFIDGRYPAVEGYKPLAREIVDATEGPTAWNHFLDRYHIQAALMKYYWDSPRPSVFEATFPRSKWALVYWDDDGALFLRRSGPNDRTIQKTQFLAVWPDAKRTYALQSLQKMSLSEKRRYGMELIRNAQLHPDSRHASEMLALFLAQRH